MDIKVVTLERKRRMEGVQIRLPPELREQAKALVASEKEMGNHINETDVYRTAISVFLASFPTKK